MADAKPKPKPFKVDYAKSNRSSCRICKNSIGKDSLRIAKVMEARQFDGYMTVWHHIGCALKKPGFFKDVADVEDIDTLRWEDQQKLRKYTEGSAFPTEGGNGGGGGGGEEDEDEGGDFVIEYAKSSRSTCRGCDQKIEKGEVRIAKMAPGPTGQPVPAWRHAKCMLDMGWWRQPLPQLPGWSSLRSEDQQAVLGLAGGAKGAPAREKEDTKKAKGKESTPRSKKQKGPAEEEAGSEKKPEKTGREGAGKGKGEAKEGSKGKGKRAAEEEEERPAAPSKKGKKESNDGRAASTAAEAALDKQMEKQTKALWEIKDALKQAPTARLKEMLSLNGQDPSGSEHDVRERCADGMMFGPLDKCPLCRSPLEYADGQYRCRGFLSAWSKCSFTTRDSLRKPGVWKIPEDTDIEYLQAYKAKQEAKGKGKKAAAVARPIRLLPPAVKATSTSDAADRKPAGKKKELPPEGTVREKPLEGLVIAFVGRLKKSQNEWKEKIDSAGGRLGAGITNATNCVISTEAEVEQQNPKLLKAKEMGIPILREDFLTACLSQSMRVAMAEHSLSPALKEVTTVKVKGRSAVHEESGLQDTAHILDHQGSVYNATLNLSDLASGFNSYYILQIIEEDKRPVCHVFRKWGRVGNAKVGGQKIERLPRNEAIAEFKRLFLEKTGNEWEAWEAKEDFEKKPGKFYPLEIDYGASEGPAKSPSSAASQTKLPPRLAGLMKMLFDLDTYRSAMLEFEINVSEMPLGKLTKRHIERGFQVLTEIQNLIQSTEANEAMRDGRLVDASNRFFTLIPTVDPKVIRSSEGLTQKIRMLETLRDIEIASKMIGEVGGEEDQLEAHYRQLRCGLQPLPHDSEDFALVKQFLERTHAPTHTEWALELEDVFAVEREGEGEAYAPFRQSLHNKMLLWHGSRTSNFVGILSQGLRIAPPEAPVTGYMFGKGVYFADLVSKSAQYCYPSRRTPGGLLLLSEVALGDAHELRKAQYMEKPPRGKHSTKGLGKLKPDEKEHQKWRDNVVVPCGKPVSSGVRATDLQYNEYIVYDQAQVKLQFLLKVRFQYNKR